MRLINNPEIGQNELKMVRKKCGGKEEGSSTYTSPKAVNAKAATRNGLNSL